MFKVIILGAGQSSRMKPLSDKVTLPFCGKTLLEHQINKLTKLNLKNFIIILNQENQKYIKPLCKELELKYSIKFSYGIQTDFSLGIKGAFMSAKPYIKKDDEILLINSNDIVENFLFEDIIKKSQEKNINSIICGKIVNKYFPGGYISIDNKGFLTDIVEKPEEGKEPSDLVNILIHYHKEALNFLTYVENSKKINNDDAYEIALKKYSEKNNIYVYPYNGYWQAVKYPWHILDLQKYFLKHLNSYISPNSQIEKNVIIKGKVFIDDNVKIMENACIKGPCYIGKNTIIGNNSFIRESIIGENSVIGSFSEITRSYLKKSVWTHNNYLGDSIIEENVSFGAGTKTANLRLDEKNILVNIKDKKTDSQRNKLGAIIGSHCRFGINCSLNPGVKIFENCFVSSSCNITKDLTKNTFMCKKENYKITTNFIDNSKDYRENI
jgi:bifunctional UDP-N-acetylglucosamine pyrophosphorylase/glucosamine-1-phosphate N-acetyltransferase